MLPDSHAIYVRSVCCHAQKQTNKEKAKQRPPYASTAGSFWLAPARSVTIALLAVARFSPSNSNPNPRPATHTQSRHLDENL
jgi:hypothetical protein